MQIDVDEVRISPDDFWNTPRYIDEAIPDDGWIYPYHRPAINAVIGGSTTSQQPFLMPVSQVLIAGQPYTKTLTPVASVQLTTTTYNWAESWLTLAFAPATYLSTTRPFSATGMTFTASNPSQGWAGMRYEPGSSGSLTDVTVERVGNGGSSTPAPAVAVTNASLTLAGITTIQSAVPGSVVDGLVVSGSAAHVVANGQTTIRDMTGHGAVVNGGARLDHRRGYIFNNARAGVVTAGTNSTAYLIPNLDPDGLHGPRITNNTLGGVAAFSGSQVRFSATSNTGDGRAEVVYNPGRGLYATSGAVLYAGTATAYQRNTVRGNALSDPVGNAYALFSGSRIWGNCNYWGSSSRPDFRIGAAAGGILDATSYLTGPPESDPPCVTDMFSDDGLTASGTTAARGGTRTRLARLSAALALDDPREAIADLATLVADAPESAEAAVALAEAGLLAADSRAAAPAAALLVQASESAHAGLRMAAWEALVASRRGAGDRVGALAAADALAGESGEAPMRAAVARVYLLGEAGRTAEAGEALRTLEALAPESVEAEMARAFLGGDAPQARARAGTAPADASLPTDKGSTGAAVALAVAPNPTPGGASVTLTLAEAGTVRVTVLDLLGRIVATPLSGSLAAGAHRAEIDGSRLSPGTYVVRAEVTVGGQAAVTTARVTVAR